MKKILILRSTQNEKDLASIQEIASLLKNEDCQCDIASLLDLVVKISPDDSTASVTLHNAEITQYDLVYFRTWHKYDAIAGTIASYLDSNDIPYIDLEVKSVSYGHKLLETIRMFLAGIPVPRSMYIQRSELFEKYDEIVEFVGSPFILKAHSGSKGRDNFLINTHRELDTALDTATPDVQFIIQEFIPNSFDYRILVLNHVAKLAYKRVRGDQNSHLNNISQGGKQEIVELLTINDLCLIAEKASRLFNRQICGVDIVISSENQRAYVLEANPAPGLSLPEAKKLVAEYLCAGERT